MTSKVKRNFWDDLVRLSTAKYRQHAFFDTKRCTYSRCIDLLRCTLPHDVFDASTFLFHIWPPVRRHIFCTLSPLPIPLLHTFTSLTFTPLSHPPYSIRIFLFLSSSICPSWSPSSVYVSITFTVTACRKKSCYVPKLACVVFYVVIWH